jgi:hypothetical protein
VVKKIFHTALAVLVVTTVTGLTINLHYCQDHLYDLALFSSAHSCCETGGQCHMPAEGNNMDHCEDSSIHVESTGEYLGSFSTFSFETSNAIDLIWIEQLDFDPGRYAELFTLKTFWYQEPPPPNEVNLTDIQTFLI